MSDRPDVVYSGERDELVLEHPELFFEINGKRVELMDVVTEFSKAVARQIEEVLRTTSWGTEDGDNVNGFVHNDFCSSSPLFLGHVVSGVSRDEILCCNDADLHRDIARQVVSVENPVLGAIVGYFIRYFVGRINSFWKSLNGNCGVDLSFNRSRVPYFLRSNMPLYCSEVFGSHILDGESKK